MVVVYTDEYAVSRLGEGDRFGRVSLRVDHDEAGNETPLHRAVFAGMAIASDNTFPGVTIYLTPGWKVILGRHRLHEDNWAVGSLQAFASLADLRQAAASGEPLCPPEVIAAAERRLAGCTAGASRTTSTPCRSTRLRI